MAETLEQLKIGNIVPVTDEEIASYLRHSFQIAEVATKAEKMKLVVSLCEQLGIAITDDELQAAGDRFREKNQLITTETTLAWLEQQRITVEEWTQGIRVSLLTQKLQEYLFGESLDANYMSDRNNYRRVALSQILVSNLQEATKILQQLQKDKASFCGLALEYSKGKHSKENGGFVGICFLSRLLPEISQAIADASEGELVGPIATQLGYHIVKVEKWFFPQLNEVREQILELMLDAWLKSAQTSP